MILYVILGIIVLYVLLAAYIKLTHRFWSIQPVFHIYNFWYWFFPPGIIQKELPHANKYCNFQKIKTVNYKDLTTTQKKVFISLLQKHYLREKSIQYVPTEKNIIPYFQGHNHDCFISYYTQYLKDFDVNSRNASTNQQNIAVITSRPMQIFMDNRELAAYYVDYLCVDTTQRKRGVAPEIIQTHVYNQRHQNKSIDIMLFKRETKLTLIVPLTIYNTYCFSMQYWRYPPRLSPTISVLRVTKENIHFLFNFVERIGKNKFSCFIIPHYANLIEIIQTENIYIYTLMQNKEIIGLYVFRNPCTFYKKLKSIECIASISDCLSEEIFYNGFRNALHELAIKYGYRYLLIENISNNNLIIQNIQQKFSPLMLSTTAYYFYNFGYRPVLSKDIFIIN